MSYGLRKLNTRTKLVAAALALAMAGVSHAQTQVGGGATLPSIGYVGNNAATNLQVWGNSTTNPTDPIAPGSLFGVYEAQTGFPNISYCLTGSGAGKDILAGGTIGGVAFSVQNTCTKNSAGTVTGFGADLTGVDRSDLSQPDFIGADSPLALSDYVNYQDNHGTTAFPTQFPAVAGAVALAFNLIDSQGNQVTSSEVNFSTAQVCEIFSGTVSNWDSTDLASAFTLPSGDSIPSEPINVQFRSDGSGTTFSLSNFLSANCGALVTSNVFEANQAFTSVVAKFFPNGVPNGVPVGTPLWAGASGNPAVANAVATTANSIGYVETANALATAPGLQFADVAGKSPTANFGSPLPIAASDVVFNQVISGTNNTNGTAALEALSTGSSTPPPTGSKCIVLVPPADYATAGSRGGIVPSTSYPIVAISYLLANAQGTESTDLTNTRNLVNAPYNSTITGSVTTIGPAPLGPTQTGTGLAFLTVASGAFSGTAPGTCVNSGE
jgi:phosphate transport system substrate-binding protein